MGESTRYIVSARKYRPGTFASVVGQEALTQTLRNAAASGRLAHAYLFCGPRGVGKTSCARIFAKRINCLSPTADGEACGECEACRAIECGSSFNIVELDAASNNSVNDIRDLMEQVSVPPQTGRYRVFIIDEVHMLSSAAFNAFLKTLEEPPEYVVFILATTEKHKVIPTILSRCQIYDFHRITIDDMVAHLRYVADHEGVTAEPEALAVIAQKADGAMRDALSIFDQVSASSGGNITFQSAVDALNVLDYSYYFRLTEAFRSGNIAQALLIYREIRDKGFDSLFFVNGLASHVRDLMVASDPSTLPLLEVGENIGRKYVELARSMPLAWYYGAMRILSDTDMNYRTSGNKQLLVELALIRLCGQGSTASLVRQSPQAASSQPQPQQQQQPQTSQPQPQRPAQQAAPQPRNMAPSAYRPAPRRAAPAAAPDAARQQAKAERTFHIRGEQTPSDASDASQPPAAAGPRSERYTEQQFRDAWESFGTAHPECHVLISAMRTLPFRPLGGDRFNLVAASQAMIASYEADVSVLVEHMRGALANDNITIGFEVGAQQPVRQRKLMPAEVLRQIVTENKVIADLTREIDAEMK